MEQGSSSAIPVHLFSSHFMLQAFIIVVLFLSIICLFAFTYAEKKVKNPVMPLTLWRAPNLGVAWVRSFSWLLRHKNSQIHTYWTALRSAVILLVAERNILHGAYSAERASPGCNTDGRPVRGELLPLYSTEEN